MTTRLQGAHVAAVALLVAAGSAVASAGGADFTGAGTLAQIARIIGAARCDSDAQCRTVGIGSLPCGGPESFLAWSQRDTDARALAERAAAHAEQRRRLHEATGMMSTCEVRADPGARCEAAGTAASRCVLLPRRTGRDATQR